MDKGSEFVSLRQYFLDTLIVKQFPSEPLAVG
jgi:hypothetical protein